MIVPIIYQNGIVSFKSECQSPVPIYGYGPVTFKVACKRVQLPAGGVHIVHIQWGGCIIKAGKLQPEPVSMAELNPGLGTCL